MEKIWLREVFVNTEQNVQFGDSGPYETEYTHAEIGKLYHALQREYGRCISRVFITTKTEDGVPVGWVFQKRMEYEGYNSDYTRHPSLDSRSPRYYIREVWCHLYAQQPVPERSTKNQPLRIDTGKAAFAYQLSQETK